MAKYCNWDEKNKVYRIRRRIKGKLTHFGTYPNEKEAALAVELYEKTGWNKLLDLIADLNKNRKPSDIFEFYDWYHKEVTIESLELFHNYYKQCKLNKLIKYICSKSNEIGGFQDYGVGIIRNRLTSQYLYDSRKRSVKQ